MKKIIGIMLVSIFFVGSNGCLANQQSLSIPTVQNGAIIVDGLTGDWDQIGSLKSDNSGDDWTEYVGDDLRCQRRRENAEKRRFENAGIESKKILPRTWLPGQDFFFIFRPVFSCDSFYPQ